MSKRWIHVTTSHHDFGTPNVPTKRLSGQYYYDTDDDTFDPGVSGSFGNDAKTKWLEVVDVAIPTFNPVTEKLEPDSSPDIAGVALLGAYNDLTGTWGLSSSIVTNDIAPSRQQKILDLEIDLLVTQEIGYTVGDKVLTLHQENVLFHSSMISRLKHLIEEGKSALTDNTTVRDSNDNIIILTINAYFNQMGNYMALAEAVKDEYLIALDKITDATTVAEVDGVVWDFDSIITP